ncbi:MAG: hypothetical protein KTR26_04905 [Flammeovirgaceae bacterium]|nr:hypothetical protein [Flammeovirgaceae bacterium]
MNPKEFEKLPLNKKGEIVFPNGEYINAIKHDKFDLMLYRVATNFYEVWYNPKSQLVHDIAPAIHERLHLYSKVDLNNLLKAS